MKQWLLYEAVNLCIKIEEVVSKKGYHVALTGGVLYKTTPRKDCDLVFYQVRQSDPDKQRMLDALVKADIGITILNDYGFVVKAQYRAPWKGAEDVQSIDFLFPEEPKDNYGTYA